jgi:hypothetical protein
MPSCQVLTTGTLSTLAGYLLYLDSAEFWDEYMQQTSCKHWFGEGCFPGEYVNPRKGCALGHMSTEEGVSGESIEDPWDSSHGSSMDQTDLYDASRAEVRVATRGGRNALLLMLWHSSRAMSKQAAVAVGCARAGGGAEGPVEGRGPPRIHIRVRCDQHSCHSMAVHVATRHVRTGSGSASAAASLCCTSGASATARSSLATFCMRTRLSPSAVTVA